MTEIEEYITGMTRYETHVALSDCIAKLYELGVIGIRDKRIYWSDTGESL
jgi:hypothetical protein